MIREFVLRIACFSIVGLVLITGANRAEAQLVTYEDIKKISPRANDTLAHAIADASDQFEDHGINTRLRMAHFLAQVMTETGGLRRLDENMNYSEKTLLRVFRRQTISRAKAAEIARQPQKIANWVYGARLGNRGRDTQDGWNYRGSGYIQLTGLFNFRQRGKEIDLPIADDPELARQPDAGLKAALAYWTARNINAAADDHDRRRVRILVNGPAAHGYAQAKVWFNKAWIGVFQEKEAAGFEGASLELAQNLTVENDETLFNDILRESGIVRDNFSLTESGAVDERASALRAFQAERGLPETGELDEATQDMLLDPVEWKYLDTEVAIPATETRNPDEGIKINLGAPSAIEVSDIEPETGTGQTVDNVQLTQDERVALTEARSIYAEYEMGAAMAEPQTFVPHSVIGTDDRVAVLDTTGFPARAVVQILFKADGAESLCSGTMISKDTVLTAGHCIHSGTLSGTAYSDFRLVPGRNIGAAPFGRCGAKSAYSLSGWVNANTSLEARYYDLGAIKLDCDIGLTTGWMGVKVLENEEVEQPTILRGYAADKAPTGRQWVSKDQLRVLWDLKGFYQNDSFGGTSGGLVTLENAPNYLVGVHTNGLHGEEPWSSNNAFTRITSERLQEIIRWVEASQ